MKNLTDVVHMEQDNYEFYTRAAQRVSDDRSRRLFTALAAEEKKHQDFLSRIESTEADIDREIELAEIRILFKDFLDSKEHALGSDVSLRDILGEAIELEEQSSKYYRKLETDSPEAQAKHIFDRLACWEDSHKNILEILLKHIDSPDAVLRVADIVFSDESSQDSS